MDIIIQYVSKKAYTLMKKGQAYYKPAKTGLNANKKSDFILNFNSNVNHHKASDLHRKSDTG
mgnify:CR=1 FL=1